MRPDVPADEPVPRRAGRREWIGLAVVALPCFLYAMDLTVLSLALPAITRDLAPGATELLWITDVYGFFVAGLLVTMGRLGDRIGRRRLLLVGAAGFGAASVLAAFAPTTEALIVARALLGIAGATLAPSTLALIRNMFEDPDERRFAIGVWVTAFSLGAALGPVAGGVLLELFWWGSVFLLAVPVMALLLVVGPRLLPEYRDPTPAPFDVGAALLSLGAILALVLALKETAHDGPTGVAAVALAVGLVLLAAFVRREGRSDAPLVDPRLLRVPALRAALAANAVGIFLLAGVDLFIVLTLQLVLGYSPLVAGLWTLPSAAAFVVGAMLAPVLARRAAAGTVVGAGLALAAAGIALLVATDPDGGVAVLVAASVVMALGVAPAVTLGTDLVVAAAPPARAGSAAAISETGAELGGALGLALLGSLGTAIYRAEVDSALPTTADADAADAARETLPAALEVAARLPAGAVDAATAAFTTGVHAVAVAAALVALVTGAVVARTLR